MGKCFLHGNGTAVERKSGSFTTSGGMATVSLGFKPDLVVIKLNSYTSTSQGYNYNPVLAFPFAEDTRGSLSCTGIDGVAQNDVTFVCTATSDGFNAEGYGYTENGDIYTIGTQTMPYIAVKYT